MGSLAPDIVSSSTLKNVAVFGAGGNLGPHIIRALLTAGFRVTVFSRPESTSAPPPDVEFRRLDFSEESLSLGLQGQHAVVAAVAKDRATTLLQRVMIDAAVRAGVQRFVPAEFGSNTEDPTVMERLPVFRSKLAVLEHLKSVAAANRSFTYTAICNGAFFDWGLTTGFLGFDLSSRHATLYSNGLTPFTATTLPTVGRAVAAALLRPSESANRYFCIAELRVTQEEVLRVLERSSGTRWTVEGRDAEVVRREGLEMVGRGLGEGVGRVILGDLFGGGGGGRGVERCGVDNEALGVEMREVGDVVREVLGA